MPTNRKTQRRNWLPRRHGRRKSAPGGRSTPGGRPPRSGRSNSPVNTRWSPRAAARRAVATAPRGLPGWKDLSGANEKRRSRAPAYLERVSTFRFGLLVLILAAAFTGYVGHVHATQDLLAELQDARRDNLRLHLKHDRLKGAVDRATGPAVIYERARTLGLEEGITYGPTIEVAR